MPLNLETGSDVSSLLRFFSTVSVYYTQVAWAVSGMDLQAGRQDGVVDQSQESDVQRDMQVFQPANVYRRVV